MFFEDPSAAFANLRSALKSGGRLAAVVWGPPEENEWSALPIQVLRRHLPARDPALGPGPFGLADRKAVARLLAGAGFVRADVAPLRLPFAADVSVLLQTGVAAAALREAGPEGERLRPQLEQELREAIGGRTLQGVALLVQASAPAVDTPRRIQ
jgi:SAM-dependent methyltransferase